ncbi:D-2-hydroxyacid dehydrogenase [Pontibacillus litoralis]|uniref:3-phosphoglycerate dehydrogenase n=1 Tax=Pontibacillus litoralis JSM 072002 TaxID=1385512 RepID=A0A0A5G7V7_9BACI|nr:D-2-hydroxyacid dehydrogenase [Pontibacillus litoralis]KGX88109.1 3-phosphoglycerate dehydrogenase [Pontibacillus litoralis JSM 072002]
MYVLSTCKMRRDLREHLVAQYPHIQFQFCHSIEEATPFLGEAHCILTYGDNLDQTHIQQAGKLTWIMVLSAGVEKLPFKAIHERNIVVTNVKGIHKVPMGEYAISMLLQVYRKEKEMIANEQHQIWDQKVKISEITGRTMMIVGAGAIGQEVARLAKAFQMHTIGISYSGKEKHYFDAMHTQEEIGDVIGGVDFVVSVLPSTDATKGFFTKAHFEQMKEDAVFLNMGRGDAVSNDLLLEVVTEKQIGHAILDVFETEPLSKDHPFWQMENVTITPHISGISPEYQPRAIKIFEQNLQAYENKTNEYVNVIDPRKGY